MKGVNIFMADGFEDVEALGTNDVLRRGGVQSNLISITDEPFVTSSHRITVSADSCLEFMECDHAGTTEEDVMIFPGGMPGSKNLAASRKLVKLMQDHYDAGGTVAAICAAPGLVLSQLRNVDGLVFTCFEGFQKNLEDKGALYVPKPAITCGQIITGRSAGHALAFGLEILSRVKPSAVESVRKAMFLD